MVIKFYNFKFIVLASLIYDISVISASEDLFTKTTAYLNFMFFNINKLTICH
jgi:hypothetical protein